MATRGQWQVALPCFVFVLHSLLFRVWLIDDAGISFAYASNLIHGHGLVAQYGVEPVEGFSNPLWTFLIAPVFINNVIDPTLYVKFISLALVFGAFVFVNSINQSLFGTTWVSRSATAATLTFVSLNTSFVVWTTSGLENPLYAFLCALYCLLMVMYATNSAGGRRPSRLAAYVGLSAAGLALTRPDGLVFFAAFPIGLAICVMNDLSKWKDQAKTLAVFLLTAIIPVAAYFMFRYIYFGDFLPNTYYAKCGQSVWDILHLEEFFRRRFSRFFSDFSGREGLVILAFLAGCVHLMFNRRKTPIVIFLIPCLACSGIIYYLLPRDWMGEYRFATPFFLLFPLVLFAILVNELNNSQLSPLLRKAIFLIFATACLVSSAIVYIPRSIRFAEEPPTSFKTVASKMGIRFNIFAEELGISDASLLCPDIGGTLCFSRLRVYDLAGLCDRKIAKLVHRNPTTLRNHILNDLRPTFIHVHDIWFVISGLYCDARFRESYVAIQESPTVWADEQGHIGYSGDYVLKAALASETDIERLRRKIIRRPNSNAQY
jgi:hypothetical protein